MAQRTLTAMFDTYDAAKHAVTRLEAAGVPHGDISIVSNDPIYKDEVRDHENTGTATGASLGTVLGGGAGLLAGLGLLAIPGLGPVVAAGWLASTLLGAGVGAAAGGVVGALTDVGISHEDAHLYAEGINRGGTLVTVRADDTASDRAADILDADGSVDIDARRDEWRGAGWNGTYAGTDPIGSAPVLDAPAAIGGAPVALPPTTQGDARRRVKVYGDGI